MLYNNSNIGWTVSMNRKFEEETKKVLPSYGKIHRIFSIREMLIKNNNRIQNYTSKPGKHYKSN